MNETKEKRSNVMRTVRSKETQLEKVLMKELWNRGLRFRRNVTNLRGKPDIAIKKYNIVIFIDSCFWHGCPIHLRMPKSNQEYWTKKINDNKARDKQITEHYKNIGWHVLRVWEHDIKSDFEAVIDQIVTFISNTKLIVNNN